MPEDPKPLAERFSTPYVMTVRPVVGDPDLALVIEDHREGSRARVWRAGSAPGDALAFPVAVGGVLTVDGRWIIDLDDDGGSEVGTLIATSVADGQVVDLTPDREPFVIRGLETSADGKSVVATVVDETGFHVLVIPADPWGEPRVVYSSPVEAWYGQISADGSLVSVDTTDHNPGVRRPAVTVVDAATGDTVGVLDDLPAGPIRAVRFSPVPGDDRLLVNTERSGFARPAIWNPRTGERHDVELSELRGEVVPLDWNPAASRILVVHVEDGVHRLLAIDDRDASVRIVAVGGAFANPDVADTHPFQWASYLGPHGEVRAVRSHWDEPIGVTQFDDDRVGRIMLAPAAVPQGAKFTSTMVPSADGTPVQVWLGVPPDREPIGTILEVHGGPNLVMVDDYDLSAQSWIDAGFAYATVNYRGSVTFGRAFREGFWGVGGDREIEDIAAAVGFLRSRGLADPASTFLTGASYGGHLTLLGLGRLPELFAGGLAQVAVADWTAAIANMNPAVRVVWSTWVPPEMVEKFSAISYVDKVQAPVWINQGAVDTRTPIIGVQGYVDRLAEHGGDVVMDVFSAGHEPTGLELFEHTQRRMVDLAHRAIAGERWSER